MHRGPRNFLLAQWKEQLGGKMTGLFWVASFQWYHTRSYPISKKKKHAVLTRIFAVKSTQFSMEQIAGSVKQAGSNEFRKVIIGCNTLHKRPNKNLFIYSRGSLLRVSLLLHGMSLQAISKHSVHRSKNCFKSFVYFLQCFDHPSVFTRSLNMTHPQALSMEKHLKINCQISDFFLGGVVYCRALGTICQGLFGPTCTQRGARLLGNITSGTMGLGHPWNWWFSIIQKILEEVKQPEATCLVFFGGG